MLNNRSCESWLLVELLLVSTTGASPTTDTLSDAGADLEREIHRRVLAHVDDDVVTALGREADIWTCTE
jgi:hypothetical protein